MTNVVSIAQSGANNVTMRNRIINGGMVIDQRNNGALVTTPTTAAFVYTIDRWAYYVNAASKFTVQRTPSATETGFATRVGAGFTNYLAMTSTSAYTSSSTDIMVITQIIEGLNFADMAWGTANAKAVTLSFWAYSSLTGTHSGSIGNDLGYSYPFSFSIPTANTWTQISVTIAGPTTSTWPTSNTSCAYLWLNMGSGSARLGAAGAWSATPYYGATGSVSVVGTSGATFYITGVQLEKGSTATPFEQRLYTTELQLCQRYFCKSSSTNVVATNGASYLSTGMFLAGAANAYIANSAYTQTNKFPVTMRTEPSTFTFINTGLPASPTSGAWSMYSGTTWVNASIAAQAVTQEGFQGNLNGTWPAGAFMWYGAWTASAEL